MKIVHICLCGAMTDGFNYQENIITKYQRQMGYEVTIIASQWIWGTNGKKVLSERTNYINDDNVKVIRLPIKKGTVDNRLKVYPDLYNTVEAEKPDILFIHDCQFLDIRNLAKYAKRNSPKITVYVDNHVDYSNGAHGWLSRNILHKGLWKYCVKKIEPYTRKFYGVLPARVDFLKELYDLPAEKCELLVMGADDELVEKAVKPEVKKAVRNKYGISEEDFLVVTGGKINRNRPETLELMRAVIATKSSKVKMLIFGSVTEDLKCEFEKLTEDPRIVFAGWQNALSTYEIMAASNLIVFPGLHSVMWEQAVAIGIPCIFRDIEGFHHVDLGGNADFVKDVTVQGLEKAIQRVLDDTNHYRKMKEVAEEEGMKHFSYRAIARQSIELNV